MADIPEGSTNYRLTIRFRFYGGTQTYLFKKKDLNFKEVLGFLNFWAREWVLEPDSSHILADPGNFWFIARDPGKNGDSFHEYWRSQLETIDKYYDEEEEDHTHVDNNSDD